MSKKEIYQPLKPFIINQRFGENKACVSTDGYNKYITCDGNNPPTGFKSVYGEKGHLGLDLGAWHGQEVYCARDGFVYFIDTHPRSGLDVRVEHNINGTKYRTIYEHLLGYAPKVGDKLSTGQLIGWADNTGWSSGDHLHFQVEILKDGYWTPIDPMSVMDNIYAKDVLKLSNKIKYVAEQVAMLADRIAEYIRGKSRS